MNIKKIDLSQLPEETSDGYITTTENNIVYKASNLSEPSVINIQDLQYSYVYHDGSRLCLFLFDFHQHYLPASYEGFQKAYLALTSVYDFDDDTFVKNISHTKPYKKQLWRRKIPVNFKILDTYYNDYQKGFEVQAPEKFFISWDLTYDQLRTCEHVICTTLPSRQTKMEFKYPVRLGNLIIQNWATYYFSGRTDVAVLEYNAHCANAESNHQSYLDLKVRMHKDFGFERSAGSYQRDDQKTTYFNLDDIQVSIVYWEDSDWGFDAGYTSLTVQNRKSYPNLLFDPDYENKIEVSDYLVLEGQFGLRNDYKRDQRVKRRPPGIQSRFGNKTVIWTDEKNGKIGFAAQDFSQLYDRTEIDSIYIGNLLPAKGRGNAHLFLQLKGQNDYKPIIAANCHEFNTYAPAIKSLTGLPLNYFPDDFDC